MTLNPPSFLPPLLAVGTGSSPNGRQSLGSGLVTHRGVLEANSFRADGSLYPQSGRGLELSFSPIAPGGAIAAYDRDTSQYLDLYVNAKNIYLSPQAGGKVSLPAGTAQALIGQYRALSGWQFPAINSWYETAAQVSVTTTGGVLRLEAFGTVNLSTVGAICYFGLGLDGTMNIDTMQAVQLFSGGSLLGYSVIGYLTPGTVGVHRASLFALLNAGTGGFWAGAANTLYVTEQRA